VVVYRCVSGWHHPFRPKPNFVSGCSIRNSTVRTCFIFCSVPFILPMEASKSLETCSSCLSSAKSSGSTVPKLDWMSSSSFCKLSGCGDRNIMFLISSACLLRHSRSSELACRNPPTEMKSDCKGCLLSCTPGGALEPPYSRLLLVPCDEPSLVSMIDGKSVIERHRDSSWCPETAPAASRR
jgi:hypothetical protein